ncbi:MAG: tetratricopeptide repeat protein [Bacteroidota bacterium]
MKKAFINFFVFFFYLSISCFGQNNIDSYLSKIEKTKNDTTKINLYLDLVQEIRNENPQKALFYLNEVEKIAKQEKFKLHVVYNKFAFIYYNLSNYKKATDYSFFLLNYCKNLKGNEKFDFEGRANELLATIYSALSNNKLAIKYQMQAIDAYKKIDGDTYYLISYINLANYFMISGKTDQAIYYYEFVERNLFEKKQYEYLSYTYSGLAGCYSDKKNMIKSLEFYEKSKNAVLKYNPEDKNSLAVAYNNIGNKQNDLGNYPSAIFNLSQAAEIFKKLDDRLSLKDTYYNLSLAYKNLKQFEESNNYMMEYMELKDSIFDEDTKQTIHDLSIKYESEKKEQENKILAKDNEKKQLTIYYSLAGILLVFIILLIIFRNNRIKAKTNLLLEKQNKIIEEQKELVEEQHFLLEEKSKEITDSIKYAERIQGAILPPEQKWNYILPNSFILNKPKDILSGDFYWIAETENQIFVAAADCTGHGVPGALISIVNFNLLNKAVLERGLHSPSEILDAVNMWLTESLNQTTDESSIKDGMDISLISIDKRNGKILFSGANNPLYIFSNNELIEVKADKFPVGAYVNEDVRFFSNKEILANFNDTIYLFSDGYADQFGGPNGKKYKYKQFKETLFKAKELPIEKQKDFLHKEYRAWRGKLEQTDDILIIGIQIK